MPFISGKQMIEHAFQHQYGIGAFSAHNAETVQAIFIAAQEEQAPIMIQVGQKVIQTLGMEPMKAMIDAFAKQYHVPVAIHLDHSREYAQTMQAIQLGFQSVMYDGSAKSFTENAQITKEVANSAKALGIGCEGEIGKIGGTEDDITVNEKDAQITTTEEAVSFAEATDIDYLAVSIGTAHGLYKQTPHIRLERLEEIVRKVNRPIVLHGGSDVPDEQVRKAIALGVSKINVDTELRQAFTRGVQEAFNADPTNIIVAETLGLGTERMVEKVREKIRCFGSAKKASAFLKI